MGQLQAVGLLERAQSEFPILLVSDEGRAFLHERRTLTLPRPQSANAGSRPAATADYDEGLFEELRAVRRRLAEDRNVPPYVVFADASLRHMAAAVPRSSAEFLDIHGVGSSKAEQYSETFLEAITLYAEKNGVQRKDGEAPTRREPADRYEAGRSAEPRRPRGATYDETMRLLSQGLSVSEIATHRRLSESTVVSHLERLADKGTAMELERLLPDAERLSRMEAAFEACGSALLRPAWEFLGEQFTYVELRLARIYLRQEGRLKASTSSP